MSDSCAVVFGHLGLSPKLCKINFYKKIMGFFLCFFTFSPLWILAFPFMFSFFPFHPVEFCLLFTAGPLCQQSYTEMPLCLLHSQP